MSVGEIKGRQKDLHMRQSALLDELKELENRRTKGEIGEEEYKERRHAIERALVEVMDRLAQMRFLLGQ